MTIPTDIAAQLAKLGEEAARYEWIVKTEGEPFLRGMVQALQRSAALFDEWHPRLVEFAVRQRAEHPLPGREEADAFSQAQQRILKPLIETAERVPIRGPCTSAIFAAPLGMLWLLMNSWPGQVLSAVFLTPAELRQWNEICPAPESDLWWFTQQWWNIETEALEKSFWLDGATPAVPPGARPLLVTHGMQWGDLAGGEQADLWIWDGQTERLLESLGQCDY